MVLVSCAALKTAPIPRLPPFSPRNKRGAGTPKIGEGAGLRWYIDEDGVVSSEFTLRLRASRFAQGRR